MDVFFRIVPSSVQVYEAGIGFILSYNKTKCQFLNTIHIYFYYYRLALRTMYIKYAYVQYFQGTILCYSSNKCYQRWWMNSVVCEIEICENIVSFQHFRKRNTSLESETIP